jgi:hypothetical protein
LDALRRQPTCGLDNGHGIGRVEKETVRKNETSIVLNADF